MDFDSTTCPDDEFILVGGRLIAVDTIKCVDTDLLDELHVAIIHENGVDFAEGVQAIDIVMRLKPSAFEGRRSFRWAKNAWILHNLVGHPLMQLCAFFGRHDIGLRIHDATVPRPIGIKRQT